jgi:hypothetical protein
MKMKCCEVPKNSIIFNDFGKVDHIDSYRIKKSTDDNIEKISSPIFRLPPWANLLMKIRDITVQPLGLKTSKPKDVFFYKNSTD